MKQADIETTTRDLAYGVPPWDWAKVARTVATQQTMTLSHLYECLADNPDWWEISVDIPNVGQNSTEYPTCLREVLYELIFAVAYSALRRPSKSCEARSC